MFTGAHAPAYYHTPLTGLRGRGGADRARPVPTVVSGNLGGLGWDGGEAWERWELWEKGEIGESRNAFGTAYRSDERLLLCDVAALRLPFGVTMSFAAFGTARHFVTLASKSS